MRVHLGQAIFHLLLFARQLEKDFSEFLDFVQILKFYEFCKSCYKKNDEQVSNVYQLAKLHLTTTQNMPEGKNISKLEKL